MNWKRTIGFLLVALLGGGGYFAYKYFKQQAELLQQYSVELIGIKFSTFSEDLITAIFTVRITNKSSIEATIERMYADVYLNGAYMGNIVNSGQFLIPAKGASDVKLQFTFANKQLLKNLVNTLLTALSTKDIPYALKGYVKVKSSFAGASLPFDYSGSLKNDMLTGTTIMPSSQAI